MQRLVSLIFENNLLEQEIKNMNLKMLTLAALAVLTCTPPSFAVAPPMPPMTNGDGNPANNGMKHANVALSGTVVSVNINTPPPSPVTMISGHGTDYTPSKFDVLENVYFNAQHGWLPDGFFNTLPAGDSIWIKRTAATQPAGSIFKVYDGGNVITETMNDWSMNEVYAVNGDIWQWDGAMQHDYFTADLAGNYSMSFDIYVGDATGVANAGFTPASTTFNFTVVPEPPTCALALLGTIGLFVRRR